MYRFQTVISLIAVMLLSWPVSGQEGRHSYAKPDLSYTAASDPWLSGNNMAGLATLTIDGVSVAGIRFDKGNGRFAGIEESPDDYSLEAYTESYRKISDRIAFYGKLSYSYFLGKEMGGPAYLYPSENPIGIIENSTGTIGNKIRELYNLTGGVSYVLSDKWSIGGRFFYRTGDYAKRKDPRNVNYRMDMDVSPSVRFAPSPNFALGINLHYRRSLETMLGRVYGETSTKYFYFIDYGGFFGKVNMLEGDGTVISTSNARPLMDIRYGAGLQADICFGDGFRFFSDFAFDLRNGYYGKKASGSVQFYEHDGEEFSYRGELYKESSRNLHKLTVKASLKTLENFENSYRVTTVPGEISQITYYGQNKALDRTDIALGLGYEGYLGKDGFRPAWVIKADAGWNNRDQTATIYPFYRNHSISQTFAAASVDHNFVSGKNIFTPGFRAGFMTGDGQKKKDGKYADAESSIKSHDEWLDRYFEFATASRFDLGCGFRFSRVVSRHALAFADISFSATRALSDPLYLAGRTRTTLSLTLGCEF